MSLNSPSVAATLTSIAVPVIEIGIGVAVLVAATRWALQGLGIIKQ
jgi:hypothetical protein